MEAVAGDTGAGGTRCENMGAELWRVGRWGLRSSEHEVRLGMDAGRWLGRCWDRWRASGLGLSASREVESTGVIAAELAGGVASPLVVWRDWVAVIGVSGLWLGLWLIRGLFLVSAGPVDGLSSELGAVGCLEVNQATEAEFLRLPGVGPGLAARIVEHRRQVGGFRTIDQLTDVVGIGQQRLGQLRGFCFVAGEVKSSVREVVPENGRPVSVAGAVSTRR